MFWLPQKTLLLCNKAFKGAFLFLATTLFLSCVTAPKAPKDEGPLPPKEKVVETPKPKKLTKTLTLLFAGDVMAHRPNYSMRDYSLIWRDVAPLIKSADLAFCNIEAPVCNSLPLSTYPNFNMHSDYAQSAVDAGFNVLSLVNNHSNDQGLEGLRATIEWGRRQEAKGGERKTFWSGLKDTGDSPFTHCLIEKDGWRVLFVAVVEILNRGDYKSLLNYTPYTQAGRAAFEKYCQDLKAKYLSDLFIVSIHCDDSEYKVSVTERRKAYYQALLKSGVDIIWANHAHVIRRHELISAGEEKPRKLIMYGLGNTISAQRFKPNFLDPQNIEENKGDGKMLFVTVQKVVEEGNTQSLENPTLSTTNQSGESNGGSGSEKDFVTQEDTRPFISKVETHFITTFIDSERNFVIKPLTNDFIDTLKLSGNNTWAKYLKERLKAAQSTE